MNSALVAILYGLGGAVGWGVSNFFAGQASKKHHPLVTVFVSQTILFLIMAVLAIIFRPTPDVSLAIFAVIAFSYLVFTVGLVISYKAYAIGPVSITAPVVGANAMIVVGSSVLLFGEALRLNQWIGLVVLFAGLFLASMEKEKSQSLNSSGIALAFIALVLIGIGLSGFVYAIGEIGWFTTVLLGYFFTAFWSAIILVFRKQLKLTRLNSSMLWLIIFQLLGTISVSYGIERSLAAIIVPVSSLNPLSASLLGVLVLNEKLNRRRLFSIAVIIVSLVIISLEI